MRRRSTFFRAANRGHVLVCEFLAFHGVQVNWGGYGYALSTLLEINSLECLELLTLFGIPLEERSLSMVSHAFDLGQEKFLLARARFCLDNNIPIAQLRDADALKQFEEYCSIPVIYRQIVFFFINILSVGETGNDKRRDMGKNTSKIWHPFDGLLIKSVLFV